MSEGYTTEELTHTVHVAIKESDGNYGSMERGAFIQFSTPRDASYPDIAAAARARLRALEADLRGEGGSDALPETTIFPTPPASNPVPTLRERLAAANDPNDQATDVVDPASVFPGAVEVQPHQDPDPISRMDPAQFAQFVLNLEDRDDRKAAMARRWVSKPGEWWDNSADKRNPKGPDYKWGKGDSEGALKSLSKDDAFGFALWKTDLPTAT